MAKHRGDKATCLLIVLLACASAHAERLPLWELGAGAAALRLPDYRGSEQSRGYLLPLPWFVYRGEILKADREGVRARLFDTDRVELDISVNGSVPVRSDRNRARGDMPDLKPIFEIGPNLNINLWRIGERRAGSPAKLELRLPVRLGVTYDDGVRDVGVIASPNLNLDLKLPFAAAEGERWNVGVVLAAVAASRRHHAYFYEVGPQFATPARPAYRAGGGWGGWQAIVAVSRRFGSWWVGGFARYDDVGGAVFADSPLVTARTNASAGIGIAYVFAESSRRVEAR